jgi:hypothetical protein
MPAPRSSTRRVMQPGTNDVHQQSSDELAHANVLGSMLALLEMTDTVPAQNWPRRPLTLVVPSTAGEPSDVALGVRVPQPRGLIAKRQA